MHKHVFVDGIETGRKSLNCNMTIVSVVSVVLADQREWKKVQLNFLLCFFLAF